MIIKVKTSILSITKAFFILFIMCCIFSCSNTENGSYTNKYGFNKSKEIHRNYTVRLSNNRSNCYYDCDSIIWITDSHFKLKNNENKEPFIDIIVPKEVIVRIYLNNN